LERLCRESGATGKLVADAQHAAIAVEHGCTMVSTDSDFSRFGNYTLNFTRIFADSLILTLFQHFYFFLPHREIKT
jgi:hypothetical protein